MGLIWRKDYLDLVLVPSGLLFMFGYHLFLLYRYLKFRDLQVDVKDRGPAINVISSNISAATSLSSISLVLSSLIGAWIGSSSVNIFRSSFVYGSIDSSIVCIKYIALLSCFLVAFVCFFQTARYLVHANFLISMPNSDIPVRYVENEVIRGSNFWLIGMRSLYFAMNLLLWIFGPIPMFVCSVFTVGVLLNLDRNTTPLHQYTPLVNHDLQKTDQEATAVTN